MNKQTIHRSHKVRIYPNKTHKQRIYSEECACIDAYNWAVGFIYAWYKAYKIGMVTTKPSQYGLIPYYTLYRHTQPSLMSTSVLYQQRAVFDAWAARVNWMRKLTAPPKAHKYEYRGSLYISEIKQKSRIIGSHHFVPGVGYIRRTEAPRYKGKIESHTLVRIGIGDDAEYYISTSYELQEDPKPVCKGKDVVLGIDLGVKTLATCSDGTVYSEPDVSKKLARQKYYQRMLSRKVLGSNKYNKTKRKLYKLRKKIYNVKTDYEQKASTQIVQSAETLVLEDLSVTRMQKSAKDEHRCRASREALQTANISKFMDMLKYKAQSYIIAERYFASTQICCVCGSHHKMDLSDRVYVCPNCGLIMDRDLNAAKNLSKYGISKLQVGQT